jgi:hypothetical protein
VYEARLKDGRTVAVKEMKLQEASVDQLRDFAAEVAVLATLVHVRIWVVGVFVCFEANTAFASLMWWNLSGHVWILSI